MQVSESVACFFEEQATRTGTARHELFLVIKYQERLKSWLVEELIIVRVDEVYERLKTTVGKEGILKETPELLY